MKQTPTEREFCRKISEELGSFRSRMLRKTKEDLFNSANEIDKTVCIYEILLEESRVLSEYVMQECLKAGSLLSAVYEKWNEMPGNAEGDLTEAVLQFLNEMNEYTA